ncbi:MAG: acyl-CoA thioesterase [Bacillota bacterium]
MFTSESRLIVRYAETDQMGIVHHSNYPIWFEVARTDFIKSMGISYSSIEERGFLLPLIELRCRYKGAARYEDEVIIRTSVKEITFSRITFYYEVFKAIDNVLITTGETVHAWTNRELKPLNIRKQAPDIYELMSKAL